MKNSSKETEDESEKSLMQWLRWQDNRGEVATWEELSKRDFKNLQIDHRKNKELERYLLISIRKIKSGNDLLQKLCAVADLNKLEYKIEQLNDPSDTIFEILIVEDKFKVQIMFRNLDAVSQLPEIKNVLIHHMDVKVVSPKLLNLIQSADFISFSEKISDFNNVYPKSMDINSKKNLLLALQSMYMDIQRAANINKESQLEKKLRCSNIDLAQHGLFGLPSLGEVSKPLKITYFITPNELYNKRTKKLDEDYNPEERDLGMQCEVGVTSCERSFRLQMIPLIGHNRPKDSSGLARFSDTTPTNTVLVKGSFYLELKPAVPMLLHNIEELSNVLGIEIVKEGSKPEPFVKLLKSKTDVCKYEHEGDILNFRLSVDNLRGFLVERILFNHPKQLVDVLRILRTQAYFNHLIKKCCKSSTPGQVSNKSKKENVKSDKEVLFEVECPMQEAIRNVVFVHFKYPLSQYLAVVEIQVSSSGYEHCKLAARGCDGLIDLAAESEHSLKVLQTTCSLPITVRRVIKRARNIKTQNQMSQHQISPPGLKYSKYSMRNISHPQMKPPNNSALQRPSIPQQRVAEQNNFAPLQQPQAPQAQDQKNNSYKISGTQEKMQQHPILSTLLLPKSESSKVQQSASKLQSQKHPMLVDLLNVTSPVIGKQQAANPKILPATMQNMHPAASKPSNIKKPNHMMMNPQGGNKMMNSPYSSQQMIQPQQGDYPPQQNSDQAMPPPPSYDAAMSQRMTNQKQLISNFSPHHQQQFYNQQNSPAAAMMHSPAQQPSPYQQFAPQQSPMYSNSPKYQPLSHQSPVHPQIQPSPHHIPPHMGMSPNPRNAARVPGRQIPNQQPDQFDFSQSDHIEPIVATDPSHPSYFINKPQQITGVNRLMQNDVQQMKTHQQSSMPVYGSMQHDNNKMKHFQNMNNNPSAQKNNPHQANVPQSQGKGFPDNQGQLPPYLDEQQNQSGANSSNNNIQTDRNGIYDFIEESRESVDSSGKISLNSRTKLMQQNSGPNKFQASGSSSASDSTLKGLFQSSPSLMSVLTRDSPNYSKLQKQSKMQSSAINSNTSSRKSSTSSQEGQSSKLLSRQTSFGHSKSLSGSSGGKSNALSKQDSKKGKASKKGEAQPVRKRGRPPSTDTKKDYGAKRKKEAPTLQESEGSRLVIRKIEDSWAVGKKSSQQNHQQQDMNPSMKTQGNASMPNQMNFMPGGGNANSNTWFSNYINQQNEMNNKKKISNNQIGVNQKNSKSYAGSQLNKSSQMVNGMSQQQQGKNLNMNKNSRKSSLSDVIGKLKQNSNTNNNNSSSIDPFASATSSLGQD